MSIKYRLIFSYLILLGLLMASFNIICYGAIQLGVDMYMANPQHLDIETILLIVGILLTVETLMVMLGTFIVGIPVSRILLKPINDLTVATKKIVNQQDLGKRLPSIKQDNEFNDLSQTINHMLTRLDNLFQAQVRLSADVSHELRTPLTIIRTNIDLLQTDMLESPEERAETFLAIDSALDRMSRLVGDLLLLSQADAGISLTKKPIELDDLMLDVFQESIILARGTTQIHLGHTASAIIYGDADRLKQLLMNLISNAIKHTPQGGRVTLSSYKNDARIRISVSDTGGGIDIEHLPHIFKRFYRVKGQKYKGAGLGLSIAKWIAEAHDGTLTVESQRGNGSTFTLRLPNSSPLLKN